MFDVKSSKKRFDANKVEILNYGFPYIVRMSTNNGIKGYINQDEQLLNQGNTIAFGQDTATMFYQENPYFTGDKIKILECKYDNFNKINSMFLISVMRKSFSTFSWGANSFSEKVINNQEIKLPTKDGKIDFEFMDACIRELEEERIRELSAYLTVSGLDNYELSSEEKEALENLKSVQWKEYNLEKLFGKSTRGKRLKSDDRVNGSLPFITAGEANTGISDFIGNEVEVFSKNTITIDMFGSAKYRNYNYGGDDHIAVVHTEKIKPEAAVFVTSTIHKSSYNGQFNYGHNFYAKDADALNIMLPTKDGKIDFEFMELLISAVQKLVIKDVILYADEKIQSTKKIVKES